MPRTEENIGTLMDCNLHMSVLAYFVYLDYSVYFVYFTQAYCVYLYFSLQSEEELNLKDVSLFQVLQRHLLDLLLGLGVQSQHVPKHQSAMTTIDWESKLCQWVAGCCE